MTNGSSSADESKLDNDAMTRMVDEGGRDLPIHSGAREMLIVYVPTLLSEMLPDSKDDLDATIGGGTDSNRRIP